MVRASDSQDKKRADFQAEIESQGYTREQAKKKASEHYPTPRQAGAQKARAKLGRKMRGE